MFKKGVDQAAKDLGSSAVKVSQVYANNDVSKQVAGVNAAIAAKVHVIATSVPDASALKDPLSRAASRGIVIITANSGLGAFDNLKTYMTHVGQTEDIAGQGAGLQFNAAGAKNLVVVIHEASNSGLTQRAAGAKKTFKGATKTLVIPNATSDLPGMQAKLRAYFRANSKTDALLGLNPDVTTAALAAVPKGTKLATFDLSGQVITAIEDGKMLFAVDQQQYLQGYLPVVFADAVHEQPQHRRRRPAGPHRPGLRQQGQRGHGGEAREGRHALVRDSRGGRGVRPPRASD